jgi:hypothetical protein
MQRWGYSCSGYNVWDEPSMKRNDFVYCLQETKESKREREKERERREERGGQCFESRMYLTRRSGILGFYLLVN